VTRACKPVGLLAPSQHIGLPAHAGLAASTFAGTPAAAARAPAAPDRPAGLDDPGRCAPRQKAHAPDEA
jgi:hypothetical protein